MIRNPAGALDEARAKEILSRNLDKYMRRRGITQVELARRAGMLRSTLNTYFVRKSLPSEDKLEALAKALEVGPDDLLPKIDQDAIREMVQGELDNASEPAHSLAAVPGRPGYSRLTLRADLPSRVAMQIMDLFLSVEQSAAPEKAASAPRDGE